RSDQDVVRLQVTVDDAFIVNVLQCLSQLDSNAQYFVNRQWPARCEVTPQWLTFDVFEHQVARVRLGQQPLQAGVIESGSDFYFATVAVESGQVTCYRDARK